MGNGALYGYSAERLAELTGAHLATARRWKRQAHARPWLARLVRLCIEGHLGEISPEWDGWSLKHGKLYSPEGWEFTPGAVRAIPLMQAQIRTYQRERLWITQADWVNQRYEAPADMTEAPIAARIRK
jgi:hypothetical protein